VDKEQRLKHLVNRLRAHGYRMTPQRMAVLQGLVRTDAHPSVEEIYRELQPTYPMMSIATVYKTVATLKELGEVLELEFSDGHNRYDAHMPQPHPHLICRRCTRIEDHPIDELDRLMTRVATRSGYHLLSMRLDFYGICGECTESATAARVAAPPAGARSPLRACRDRASGSGAV
jgi:Fur family peroxide stress response transcriptional regulator